MARLGLSRRRYSYGYGYLSFAASAILASRYALALVEEECAIALFSLLFP